MSMRLVKTSRPQRRKLRFKKKRTNLKLKELLLSFSLQLKKLHQNHSKKIMLKDGIIELLLTLPEVLLLVQLLPNMLKKPRMSVRTLVLSQKLLMLLPLSLTLTLEIEKVLMPTHGTSTGSPRLFLNQMVMPIVLTDN
mgnify:CR=1 FL=1